MVNINDYAPEFIEDALVDGKIKKVRLGDYRGKWVVLFFYPADFTFVCPTIICSTPSESSALLTSSCVAFG